MTQTPRPFFGHRGTVALILALAATASLAQGPVLKPSQVTESALVDALGVAPAADSAGGTATRSIRPTLRQPDAAKPAAPGKANLLITFATGSADLSPETIHTLEVVAKALQSDRLSGLAFRVEGHADPRGSADYNMKLSAERAQAVVGYLTTRLGVLPDRLVAVGKGSTEPLDATHPEAIENRRVTIVTDR
jgi:outer membrane protein OmpA-like peptidoglycan-associated protein